MGRHRSRFEVGRDEPTFLCQRVFDAPPELLFDAHTQPRHLIHWWGGSGTTALSTCEVDLRPGGSWRFVYTPAGGSEVTALGRYLEVARPSRLVFTLALRDAASSFPEGRVSISFDPEGQGTRVTVRTDFPTWQARELWSVQGARSGSLRAMRQLDGYLRHLDPPSPTASPSGTPPLREKLAQGPIPPESTSPSPTDGPHQTTMGRGPSVGGRSP